MSVKSDTWMAFYVGDYLANTLHLAREHHGSYLMLILAAFKNDGWLPGDDGLLAQIAKATPEQWATERAMYARFFDVTDERWTHRRVTRELEKAERMTVQRSDAGKASAAKRQRDRQRESNDRSTGTVEASSQQTGRPSPSPSHDPNGSVGADAPKPHCLPADWKPSDELRRYAIGKGHDADVVAKAFVDYWTGSKGRKTKRENWDRTFEVWCDRETPRRAVPQSFAQQREQAAATVANRDGDGQWRQRVKAYRPGAKWWLRNDWGPPPGEPGCRVPAHILAEVGTP